MIIIIIAKGIRSGCCTLLSEMIVVDYSYAQILCNAVEFFNVPVIH
jgi:hypothetical protein